MVEPQKLSGKRFGIIADAHIHPGKTPPFPERLDEIFHGADGIIALGDMGESAGLDWLARLAPVHAIRGEDDQDARASAPLGLFSAGTIHFGAVFDGVRHGLFSSNDPLSVKAELPALLEACFGQTPAILLCASTHKPFVASSGGILIVNPGSPTMADRRTVATLKLRDETVAVEHHDL